MGMITSFQDWKYREITAATQEDAACMVCLKLVKGECFFCPSLKRLVHSACFFHQEGGSCNLNDCKEKHLPITHYRFQAEHTDFAIKRVIVT